jgi:hypothetical protein
VYFWYEGKVYVLLMSHTQVNLLLHISFEVVEGFSECSSGPDCSTDHVHIFVLPSDFVPYGNMVGM